MKRASAGWIQIYRYCLWDLLRSRFVLAYFGFFLLASFGIFRFAPNTSAAFGSLLSAMLLVSPLCCQVYGTLYFYQSRGFHELMLAQPIGRGSLGLGQWLALASALCSAFFLGVGVPMAVQGFLGGQDFLLLAVFLGGGLLLHLAFLALAFWVGISIEDRLKGFSLSLLIWLALVFLYDGIVLVLVAQFSDYPLEKPVLAAMLLNPVDLERVLILMRLDSSALLGYTGAVFRKFFGTGLGTAVSMSALTAWIAGPLSLFYYKLKRKDW